MNPTIVLNCGSIVSGDIEHPVVEGDSIRIEDGRIVVIGSGLEPEAGSTVIDARGGTLVPGLIDSHSHPVVGDYTPRQNTGGWTQRAVHGAVTSLISAGETHWPGRLKDGKEAVAISQAAFLTTRQRLPGSARVFGGSLLLDVGVTDGDLHNLHALGVRALGEVGLGSEKNLDRVQALVETAKELGWVVPLHFGGASVPGSSVIDLDIALKLSPTVISHANGGPTSRPFQEIKYLVKNTDSAIELVFAGNMRIACEVARLLLKRDELWRLQFGTDTPSGTGVVPLGMLRILTEVASRTEISPELLVCAATGGTAKRYGHNDLGVIEVGRMADLAILQAPLGGGAEAAFDGMRDGNVPAVAAVLIEGQLVVDRSVATPPPLYGVTVSRP